MLASAGDISLEQVLRIIFGILSGPLALCMLMLSYDVNQLVVLILCSQRILNEWAMCSLEK